MIKRLTFGCLVLATTAVALLLLLGPIASWLTPSDPGRAATLNATRQTLLAAVGGTVVFTGAGISLRTFWLTRRAQFTSRYSTAVTLLSSERAGERIGGLYFLEQLMRESRDDHDMIVEVFAAFVRDRAPLGDLIALETRTGAERPSPAPDVQVALTILGRRPNRPERSEIDLSRTDLRGAGLEGARLAGVALHRSALDHVILLAADLRRARFQDASLQRAFLCQADLDGATLFRARLDGARLSGASLAGTYLVETDLADVDFTADDENGFPDAKGLQPQQVSRARLSSTTRLPDGLELNQLLVEGQPG